MEYLIRMRELMHALRAYMRKFSAVHVRHDRAVADIMSYTHARTAVPGVTHPFTHSRASFRLLQKCELEYGVMVRPVSERVEGDVRTVTYRISGMRSVHIALKVIFLDKRGHVLINVYSEDEACKLGGMLCSVTGFHSIRFVPGFGFVFFMYSKDMTLNVYTLPLSLMEVQIIGGGYTSVCFEQAKNGKVYFECAKGSSSCVIDGTEGTYIAGGSHGICARHVDSGVFVADNGDGSFGVMSAHNRAYLVLLDIARFQFSPLGDVLVCVSARSRGYGGRLYMKDRIIVTGKQFTVNTRTMEMM